MSYVYTYELLIQEANYKDQDHSSIQSLIFTSRTWYQITVQNFDKTFDRTRADWCKYLPLATFTHNTFYSPILANHSPYELVFRRKLKLLLDLETDPDVNVSGTYREYFLQLSKRLEYLHKLLQDFWMKRLALINKDRDDFQYNSGDLVYII